MISRYALSLLTILLGFTATAPGQAPGVVRGTVFDPQHAAVARARVSLIARDTGSTRVAESDAEGRYQFVSVRPGEYLLSCEASGFARSAAHSVVLNNAASAQLDLNLRLDEPRTAIVVTASGTPQSADEVSKALTVVDRAAIDARDEFSIPDALREVPALRVQQLGGPGGFTTIKTRGLPTEETAILIDGFRLRDAASTQGDGSAFLEDLVVTNVDRIEVLRGAGSSLYGSNATGGAINIVTGETGGPTHGTLLTEGGSLDLVRARATLSGSLDRQKVGYSLGLSHLNVISGLHDDPARTSSAQGRLDYLLSPRVKVFARMYAIDSFSKLKNTAQAGGTVPKTGVIDAIPLSDSELHRYESGAPISQLNFAGATYIPASDNPDDTRAARIYSGAIGANAQLTESMSLTASYQGLATARRFGDGPAGPGFQPKLSTQSFYDGEIHTATARADWRLGRHQLISGGYEFESENYGNRSLTGVAANDSAVDVTERSNAVFAQDQIRLLNDRLQISGSVRAQLFSLRQPVLTPRSSAPYPGQTFDAPPAAKTADASIAYTFRTETKIRSHAGKGYRAPSLYERFGTYYGSFGYSAYGDPRLKPGRSIGFDAGIDQNLWRGRARLSATYFYTQLQEIITFDFSGAISPSTDPYGRYGGYRNAGGGLARGVEVSASVSPIRTMSLRGSYTYTNALQRTPLADGVIHPYVIPNHQFSLVATERLTVRTTVVLDYRSSSNYLMGIYNPSTFATRAYRFPGINQLQLGGSYRVPVGDSRALKFIVKVSNVGNQAYYENGYATPGRTALGGLQFEF